MDKLANVSARRLTEAGILNAKSPTLEQAIDYLVGLLVESNDYVSKEITNGFNAVDENHLGRVCSFQKGSYLMNVGIIASYRDRSNAQINIEDSKVHIEFETLLRTTSKALIDLPRLSNGYNFALYNHKTGFMSKLHSLSGRGDFGRYAQIYVGECKVKPDYSKETIERHYKASSLKDEPFALSLLVFDSNQNLIVPG